MSASSWWDSTHAPDKGVLDFQETAELAGAWVAGQRDLHPWLMVDLQMTYIVTALITQGRNYCPCWPWRIHENWVTSYYVTYGVHDGDEITYSDDDGIVLNFSGNSDRDTLVRHELSAYSGLITARYVKFHPLEGHIAMRAGVVVRSVGEPVGWWPLDEAHGARDATGSGNDGIAVGTQLAEGPAGPGSQAFLFAGNSTSYIEIPNNASGKLDVRYSYTILAHIYPTGDSGPLFQYGRTEWGVHFWQLGDPLVFFNRPVDRNGDLKEPPTAVLTKNHWNYVGATYDYGTGVASVWHDGIKASHVNIGTTELGTQYVVRVGHRETDARSFSGRISCLQLYDYAMDEHQVAVARRKCEGLCPYGWYPAGHVCYRAFDEAVNWTTADSRCRREGGRLASVKSPDTHNFLVALKNTVDPNGDFWIGLNNRDQEGVWKWTDGKPVGQFEAWHPGEPDGGGIEQCAPYDNGRWADWPCDHRMHFVCERVNPPENVTCGPTTTSSFELHWLYPYAPMSGYHIWYHDELDDVEPMELTSAPAVGNKSVVIGGLKSGSAYNITVRAVVGTTESLDVTIQCTTDICPNGWHPFGYVCYRAFAEAVNWTTADTRCRREGGRLASVKDSDTHDFLVAHIVGPGTYWIGLNDRDQEGVWKWTDGKPVSQFEAWYPGEPNGGGNEQCATYINGLWGDWPCDHGFYFVCERVGLPVNVTCGSTTASSFVLHWLYPYAPMSGYHIWYHDVLDDVEPMELTSAPAAGNKSVAVGGLKSGSAYNVTVRAVVGTTESPDVTAECITETDTPESFACAGATSSSVTVSWTRPQAPLTAYRANFSDQSTRSTTTITTEVGSSAQSCVLQDAQADQEYHVTLVAVGLYKDSLPVTITCGTMTPPPEDFGVTSITSTSMRLSWTQVSSSMAIGYRVWIRTWQSSDILSEHLIPTSKTDVMFKDLTPATKYIVSTASVNPYMEGPEVSVTLATETDPPSTLDVEHKTTDTVVISWRPPEAVVVSYSISYTGNGRSTSMTRPGDVNSCELTGLTPGTRYDISLVAVSRLGRSIAVNTSVVTDTDPPSSLAASGLSTTWMFLAWKPSQAEILSYELTVRESYSSTGRTFSVDGSQTSYNLTNLLPDTDYVINMASISAHGRSVEIVYSNRTGSILPIEITTAAFIDTTTDAYTSGRWSDVKSTKLGNGITVIDQLTETSSRSTTVGDPGLGEDSMGQQITTPYSTTKNVPDTLPQQSTSSPQTSPSLKMNDSYCEEDMIVIEEREAFFPRSEGGSFAYSRERCPSTAGYEPLASRFCRITTGGIAVWDPPVVLMCNTSLQNLSRTEVTNETALAVATKLQVITNQTESLSADDVTTVSDLIQDIVNVSATEQIGDSLLTTIDNLMKINASALQLSQLDTRGPTRIVQALETFADTVTLATEKYTSVRPAVALQAADISLEELDKGQGFSFSGNSSTSLTEGRLSSFTSEDGRDPLLTADVSITLPANLSNLPQLNDIEGVRLSYTLYNTSSLFVQSSNQSSDGSLGTRIIGSRIAGLQLKNLPQPVIITFAPLEAISPEDVKEVRCVFWDFEAAAGQGAWSPEGCEYQGEDNGRYTCTCNHLTNFAAFFDVSGSGFGLHDDILEVLTIVGCSVSITSLVLTLLSFIITRSDNRRVHAKNQRLVLSNLCAALLAILIIFLAGINQTASPIGCTVVAALLHYFLLAALLWMAVEAISILLAAVLVFDHHVSENFGLKAAAVAWGFPFLVMVSTVGPSSLYEYRMKNYCWLAHTPLTYAFLLPAGLILLFNMVVFVIIMYKLVTGDADKRKLRGAKSDAVHSWIIQQLRRAVSLMALFGLTWVFGFFVITDARIVFAYLFCIFNTLQGLFIFVFHCVMREDMKKFFCKENGRKNKNKYVLEGCGVSSFVAQTPQLIEFNPLSSGGKHETS